MRVKMAGTQATRMGLIGLLCTVLLFAGCDQMGEKEITTRYRYRMSYMNTLSDRGNVHGEVTVFFKKREGLSRLRRHRARFQQAIDIVVRPYRSHELDERRMKLILERVCDSLYPGDVAAIKLEGFSTTRPDGSKTGLRKGSGSKTFHDG